LAFEADVADAANADNEDVRFFGASSAINWSESYSKSEFCSRVRYIARLAAFLYYSKIITNETRAEE